MELLDLIQSAGWDFPFYKVLARNDTGQAVGNQAGLVVPISLVRFFPELSQTLGATASKRLLAELYLEQNYLTCVFTRYQYQTRRNSRSPEFRLTVGLGPILNEARADDVLLFQQSFEQADLFRLILVRQDSPEYRTIETLVLGRTGSLFDDVRHQPRFSVIKGESRRALLDGVTGHFELFDHRIPRRRSNVTGLARSAAFRELVLFLYRNSCAVCGAGLQTPTGLSEVDAAHVVPHALGGADDLRNGFALCKRHHWAFDNGLYCVGRERKIEISRRIVRLEANRELLELDGRQIIDPTDFSCRVHPDAFKWHQENIFLG